MSRLRRKLFTLACILLIVCFCATVAGGVYSMRKTMRAASVENASVQPVDPFISYRTARQQLRALQKAQLNDVAHDADTDPDLAQMAQRQLLELCTREEQELILEGILNMRGWEDAIVTVHQNSVNVLIRCDMVTRQESSLIMDHVCRETGIDSGNVKIIPIN